MDEYDIKEIGKGLDSEIQKKIEANPELARLNSDSFAHKDIAQRSADLGVRLIALKDIELKNTKNHKFSDTVFLSVMSTMFVGYCKDIDEIFNKINDLKNLMQKIDKIKNTVE